MPLPECIWFLLLRVAGICLLPLRIGFLLCIVGSYGCAESSLFYLESHG